MGDPDLILDFGFPSVRRPSVDVKVAVARMDIAPAIAPRSFQIPHFKLKRDKHSSAIQVGKWSITATKRPILNGKEIEAYVRLVFVIHERFRDP